MSGASSWNDLTDKPFGSEMVEGVITFDGDLTGREAYDPGDGSVYAKMSDRALTVEELVGSTVVLKYNMEELGAVGDTTESFVITDEFVDNVTVDDSSYAIAAISPFGFPFIISTKGEAPSMLGMTLTEGTYYIYADMNGEYFYTESVSCLIGPVETIKTIDPKYLPEGISSWNNLTDKPFGEEQAFEPIVWDGNIDGKETFNLPDGRFYIQISETILTQEQLAGAKAVCLDGTYNMDTDLVDGSNFECTLYLNNDSIDTGLIVIVDKDAFFASSGIAVSNGIYAISVGTESFVLSIANTTTKRLDEKYMPILTSPSGKKFKLTVDDSGTISATEV